MKPREFDFRRFISFKPLCSLSTSVKQRMVQPFCVFSEDDHVDHVRIPNVGESTMDFVRNTFIEANRANVCIQVEPTTHSKNDRSARKVAVWQSRTRISNRTHENSISIITAEFERTLCPLFPSSKIMLTAAWNHSLLKPMVCVLLDCIQNALCFDRYFLSRSIAGKHRNNVVAHASSTSQYYMKETQISLASLNVGTIDGQ